MSSYCMSTEYLGSGILAARSAAGLNAIAFSPGTDQGLADVWLRIGSTHPAGTFRVAPIMASAERWEGRMYSHGDNSGCRNR